MFGEIVGFSQMRGAMYPSEGSADTN